MKEFLTFGCFFVRFSDVFFSSCTLILYISLTCERLFFNFGSEGNACLLFHIESCFYRIFFAPKVIGASRVTALDDDDVLTTR
jgi:hypothetical protein